MKLANGITLARIVLIPIVIGLMYQPAAWLAGLFFALVAGTDWLDGYVARKYDQISDLGKFLDPLADKLLVISVLIVLAAQLKVDVFSVIILTAREFAIMGLRVATAKEGNVIAASQTAKLKTATQMVAIVMILLNWPNGLVIANLSWGLLLYYFSVIVSIISLVEYFWQHKEFLRG